MWCAIGGTIGGTTGDGGGTIGDGSGRPRTVPNRSTSVPNRTASLISILCLHKDLIIDPHPFDKGCNRMNLSLNLPDIFV